MNKKQISETAYQYIMIFLILAAIAYRGGREFIFQKAEVEVEVDLPALQEVFPEIARFEINRFENFDVFDNKEKSIGTVLLSTNYSQQYGYGGIVPLLIGLDDSLKITKIVLLPNNETYDYVRAVYEDRFIGAWEGLSLEEAVDFKADAVSGATHTSRAVIAGVRHTAAALANVDAALLTENSFWGKLKDILFLSLMLVSLVFAFKKGMARYRVFYVFMVLLIMGLILNNVLSAQLLHGWLLGGFSWQANWQSTVVFLLAISIAFIGKRKYYCNYLCPMGALQELTNRFTPFKKRSLPTRYKSISLREVYLILIAGALLLGFTPGLSYLEPFMFFSFRIAGIGLIVFGLSVVVLSLFFNKPWCAVCPTGCLLDTISYKKVQNTKS